ncbi:MAG: MazG nucleotide pyrophosphohydrolase domain-containing protein [Marinomonas sp.]|jgi:NTP pyrophosphatase (non-canonical NTP hydrolase)
MQDFEKLIKIVKRKSALDQGNTWSNGSSTYLEEIKKEVDEVIEEMPKQRDCYLEDELADVLWDYLNVLQAIEQERGISIDSVLARACHKYEERISGLESGKTWAETKQNQKLVLAKEQAESLI